METMDTREIAFSNQIRLGFQPMLHLVTGLRALIFIGKVSFSGHLIRRGRKINFVLIYPCCHSWPGCNDRLLGFG